ncbi:putative methyltransferase [Phycisphaerae bacterium RAS1]|nr:putative methyltransferase [Phycisphaerae bacterium RAS1]
MRHDIWRRKPLLREIYRRYFAAISGELAPGRVTIEIGGGSGMAREFLPAALISDIVGTPHVDFVADAMRLPLRDGGVDNLFMIDVLHHLPRPWVLFDEAARVLRPGGRLVMLEPHISPASRLVFKLAHPEPVDMSIDPLPQEDAPLFSGGGPFDSNQAIPTLLFRRHAARFAARFTALRVGACRLDSVFVYPLSGGFSGPCLIPSWLAGVAWGMERFLRPLARLLAFRLLVVVERI